jgi:isopenicillin-N epimerase
VTSWSHGQPFPASFDLAGTVDPSAWLAIPDGLAAWERLGGWELVSANAELVRWGADHLADALGTRTGVGGIRSAPAMTVVGLPDGVATTLEDATALWHRLYAAGFVVAPVSFEGRGLLRLAAQAYNDESDYVRLGTALSDLLGCA